MSDLAEVRENVVLAAYTTMGVGGPARFFVEAGSEEQAVAALKWARERSLPVFVLGGGSNLLVADAGFEGLVLRVALRGVELEDGGALFRAAAGEDWDRFVQRTVGDGCAGIECLAGIPGSVGGTPVQNVGAYGQEVAETIERVRVLELETLEFREMTAGECEFSYRKSRFNSVDRGRFLVTRVDFRLRPGGRPELRYADLVKAFEEGASASLVEVAAQVRRIRRTKGMLLVEGDVDCRSAGSFFKNPLVSEGQVAEIVKQIGERPPTYPGGEGMVKLPAAWLIEKAGFAKGLKLGRVGISSRHSLALVNLGGATAAEVLALRDLIVERVGEFGIRLEMEPVLLGF
jgi:UDP-N-acetylmuramate dehydrogenase